ncbi:PilZ domain-containing protein [Pseudaeromonas sharmana]|uniref:PilZ domain-containing protein n=1 Tax=Pseudaeromonas sharmana TaxID=328412 RepID=A0ABV8CLS5_9GAMM
MQHSFVLNQDERLMLRELFSAPAVADEDLSSLSLGWDHASAGDAETMLAMLLPLLQQAEQLVLHANYGQHRFSFRLSVAEDEWGRPELRFSPPLILDVTHSQPRAWRACHPSGIHLTDQAGRPLDWHIRNLSATGMQLDGPVPPLPAGIRFQACLAAPELEPIPICGQMVRQEELSSGWRRCVVRLHLDDEACFQLNQYLYQQHLRQYPIPELLKAVS